MTLLLSRGPARIGVVVVTALVATALVVNGLLGMVR